MSTQNDLEWDNLESKLRESDDARAATIRAAYAAPDWETELSALLPDDTPPPPSVPRIPALARLNALSAPAPRPTPNPPVPSTLPPLSTSHDMSYTKLYTFDELPKTKGGQIRWPWSLLTPGDALLITPKACDPEKPRAAFNVYVHSMRKSINRGKRKKPVPYFEAYNKVDGFMVICKGLYNVPRAEVNQRNN